VPFSVNEDELLAFAHIQLENYSLSLSDCDEAVEMILRKCERGLRSVLDGQNWGSAYAVHLYQISTCIGWAQGCEILFGSQYIVSRDGETSFDAGMSLLVLATRSCDLSTLDFWLRARERADDSHLAWIGTPEDILWFFYDHDFDPIWLSTVLDALVHQRQQLQALLEIHAIEVQCHGHDDRVLDAHAGCAIDCLEAASIYVPGYLRPSRCSIYYSQDTFLDYQVLDKL